MKTIDVVQGEDIWHFERWGSATGTRFQNAVGAKYSKAKGWTVGNKEIQETLMLELISENRSKMEVDDFQSAEMMRGTALEPLSVKATSEKFKIHLEVVGMLQSDLHKMFKFSPDAVYFNKDKVITGGFETKSKSGKKHIEYMLANELPKEHFWQCLCPMVMSKHVKWWIFAHFDDRDMIDPLFTTTLKRADHEELIAQCEVLIVDFLNELDKRTIEMGGYYVDPLKEAYYKDRLIGE